MNNDKIGLLIIQPLMDELTQRLTQKFNCHFLYQQTDVPAYLNRVGNDIRAVATRGDVGLDTDTMQRLPLLECIAVFGVGTDGIDLVQAKKRNIQISITSDILTDDVADLAMGLIIATSRQIVLQDKFSRTGTWGKAEPRLANRVSGKKIGILGLGKIGSAIARRAEAFNMQVGFCDRTANNSSYVHCDNLHALAEFSDFLVLALPGGGKNTGIINQQIFQSLGPRGILINIARGSLVNETDLIQALNSGAIGGAGLDVYCHEPHIPEALFKLDNVVITPHIASGTVETRHDMAENVFANLANYFALGQVLTPVM